MEIDSQSSNQTNYDQILNERLKFFEKLKIKDLERISKLPKIAIKCTLASGEIFDAVSFETTPKDILKNIKIEKKVISARVNGILWDLGRPFEADSRVEFVGFDEADGKYIYWHTSAHILGQALEKIFGAKLCSGPPVETGFYYDVFMDHRVVTAKDLPEIKKACIHIIKERQKFERITVNKADLLELFQHNEFKIRIISEKVDDFTTVYRCGSLVDLCRGPHLDHTGVVSAFAITKNSSSYWKGQATNEHLQRVYGVSFPSNDELKQWLLVQEEAEKRDHRKLGREHELFFFHELSPGSCFFLPKGAHIYNKLCDFIRTEYRKRGFTEVISPNMYNVKLWKTSGHYENYAENMFLFNVENEEFALKPMNCPGHCLMFGLRPRSWKELPLRFADFGVLHRNELSGALSGLTRVRRFCQDDAHIFCTLSQVGDEIKSCLDFLFYVNTVLGFTPSIKLSTKPEKFIGDSEIWERAESELKRALDESGKPWELNPGDGAFYGPKIDIQVRDALGRHHQTSTIQLDFNLPKRFQLKYIDDEDKSQEPVMIHRAILGSLERIIGVLTESYAGKWPFWLNPTQFVIISMCNESDSYAFSIQNTLRQEGFTSEVSNDPTVSLNKKIRNSCLTNSNFIILVGKKEMNNKTVSLRTRKGEQINDQNFDDMLKKFHALEKSYKHGDDLDSLIA